MLYSLGVVVASCSLVWASCDDDGGVSGAQTTNVLTYNVGLADGYVPLADERLPALVELLDATDFDVVCLEEVWSEEDVLAIAESENTPYADYYWVDTTEEPQPPTCTETDVADLQTCAEENDCETATAGLVACAAANCGDEISDLTAANPDCLDCLASQLDAETVDDMMTACIEEGGGTMNQNGRNGLLLLSKTDFEMTEHLVLSSFLNQRIVLHGRVELPGIGTTDVFCTHLATEIEGIAYRGEYESYEDEQAQQTLTLLDWIDSQATTGQVVLMGDFNNGPAVGSLNGELAENYALVTAAGYIDPYASAADPLCTFCDDNTLITSTDSRIIDHIFFKGMPGVMIFDTTRFGDETVEVEVNGSPQQTHPSDHYGVIVEVTPGTM